MPILSLFRRFLSDRRGNFALTTAVMSPVFFGVVGLAFDYSIYANQRSAMQDAADAAALAAISEASVQGWNAKVLRSTAKQFVKSELKTASMSSAVYDVGVSVKPKNNQLSVTVSQDGHGYLLLGFIKSNPQIEVSAVSTLASATSVCVLTLDPDEDKTLKIGKKSAMVADNCGIFANSTDANAIKVNSGAVLAAETICSSGGWDGRKLDVSPEPVTDCPPMSDPLIGRAPPSYGGCDYNKYQIKKSATLKPGVYCGGLEIDGSITVKLSPGVYVIKDGDLKVKGNASLIGKNVGFYITGDDAEIAFENSSQINLTAPKAGAMAGILFFGDRSSKEGRHFEISSQHAEILIGTIYLPNGTLVVKGKTNFAEDSDWTAIIAQEVEIDNGPVVTLHSDYASSDIPVPAGVAGKSGRAYLTQ